MAFDQRFKRYTHKRQGAPWDSQPFAHVSQCLGEQHCWPVGPTSRGEKENSSYSVLFSTKGEGVWECHVALIRSQRWQEWYVHISFATISHAIRASLLRVSETAWPTGRNLIFFATWGGTSRKINTAPLNTPPEGECLAWVERTQKNKTMHAFRGGEERSPNLKTHPRYTASIEVRKTSPLAEWSEPPRTRSRTCHLPRARRPLQASGVRASFRSSAGPFPRPSSASPCSSRRCRECMHRPTCMHVNTARTHHFREAFRIYIFT